MRIFSTKAQHRSPGTSSTSTRFNNSESARIHGLGSRRRGAKARSGTYTVEFAICATVFFMVIFAGFELTRFIYLRQAINQIAYEAARTGVIVGANADAVSSRAEQLLAAYGVVAAQVDVSPSTIDETTREVTVAVSCNYSDNSWAAPNFVKVMTLESSVTLDHENQAYLISDEADDDEDLNSNDEPLDV